MLEGIIKNQRLAAAYLFVGPPGSDKAADAAELAERLGCGRFDRVEVGSEGATLKIDQIRELQKRVRHGPTAGKYLLVTVTGADEMTPEAAAAFLKTLEEPPAGVVFVLLAAREDRLPETIVSRCQKIIFEEKLSAWRPDPELEPIYAELKNIRGRNPLELLSFASKLGKESERLEGLLYELVGFAKEELQDICLVRILLEAVKNLKKKANQRLILEVACLKMGAA